ncbi:DUF898 domain-containing protein [bacterium]|nr:DUF898 domain-containing protein [bacterium]
MSEITHTTYRSEYKGTGESLFFLCLTNFILRVVTLNIYYPWAKTNFRRYVWANTYFLSEPLVYRGLGKEIFIGFLKVIGIYFGYGIVNAVLGYAIGGTAGTIVTAALGAFLAAYFLPRIILGTYRYRLTRTTWRGVRFGVKAIEKPFTLAMIKGWLLTIITLGFYYPLFFRTIYQMRTDATFFGNLNFRYSGKAGEEYAIWVKGVLLSILTLGIYSFWFHAELMRYRFAHTHVGEATLSRHITGVDFFVLYFLCGLGILFTLGLAYPWVFSYRVRVLAEKTFVTGAIDFDGVVQAVNAGGAAGDAAADFFDIGDVGFSFDL